MRKYDIAILGSGLGGLQCGYVLSKHGYKVAIFEKQHQFGGCLQVFHRKGYTFDTGMHYLGGLGEGEILHNLFNYYAINQDVKLKKLDTDCFDKIVIEDKVFPYAMGYENFIETLSRYFPKERQGIAQFIEAIQKIAHASPLYNLQEINSLTFIESDYIKKSVGEFIASFTQDPTLQNVLAGTNPLYAGFPEKTPVYVHALIMHSYIKSSWRIIGGSHTIVDSLVNSIRNLGGEIFNRHEVTKINCNSEKVVSIETVSGETIEANYFISNIHPAKTLELIDSHLIRNAFRYRINSMENTTSNFTLYLAFKPNRVPYLNHNHYQYFGKSVWHTQEYSQAEWPKSFLYMQQSRATDEKYANSAQVVAFMNFDDVKQWENTKVGNRGQDYLDFKEEKAQKLLDCLEQHYPGIKENIAFYETSTPLTYRDYTGSKDGSLYGILRDCHFPAQTLVSQRTKIPNLFLTGQNINAHGFLGVSIGSIITCAEFLGVNRIMRDIELKGDEK
ncbi:MAG: NAD(P)/FAD-dependent oxidoreductase [Bacteroidetes bacterium]|nr:NAD(P)/FAD-dependent oxidoreductase [Bacteroidota bacterium]